MAFFASSVIGSFSTVCVSALIPNAVDKITSMVRLWSHLEKKKRINSFHIASFAQRPRKGSDGRNYQGTYDWYFMLILYLQLLYVYTSCISIFFRFGVFLSYIWNLWRHFGKEGCHNWHVIITKVNNFRCFTLCMPLITIKWILLEVLCEGVEKNSSPPWPPKALTINIYTFPKRGNTHCIQKILPVKINNLSCFGNAVHFLH